MLWPVLDQILEAAPHKEILRQFGAYLTKRSSKTNKSCRVQLDKQERTHKWHSLVDSDTPVLAYQKRLIPVTLARTLDAI